MLRNNQRMEIITRQQAIMSRSTKYFTGVPCRNGHIAQRYTRCAVCLDCLHPKFSTDPAAAATANSAARDLNYKLAVAKIQMIRIKIVLHSEDLALFIGVAHALSICREPALSPEDLLTKFTARPRGDSTYLHAFKCYPEDAAALYQLQEDLTFVRLTPAQQAAVTAAADRRIA
jgi:hypothetical protein